MKSFSFFVPGPLPGRNEQEAAARGNRYAAASMKKAWTERVYQIIVGCLPVPKFEKVVIVLHWFEKDRRRDKDNIFGFVKYLLDGMVKAGLIENDGWKHVENFVNIWGVNKENPGVFVEVFEWSEWRNK